MTNRIVAAFPGAELIKILKKFARMSLHIIVGPLTKFLKYQACHGVYANTFNQRFVYEMGCYNIHAASAHRGAKKQACECLPWFAGRPQKWPSVPHKAVTGDESWCYSYEPESKQRPNQWKSPNSPRPKTAWQVHSSVKKMLISFYWCWRDSAQGVCSSRTNSKSAIFTVVPCILMSSKSFLFTNWCTIELL